MVGTAARAVVGTQRNRDSFSAWPGSSQAAPISSTGYTYTSVPAPVAHYPRAPVVATAEATAFCRGTVSARSQAALVAPAAVVLVVQVASHSTH